jgi:dTDP-4-dehydrorhamnose 3,5-epimerase
MALKITEMSLPGVLAFEPDCFGDERGFFMETYNATRYGEAGFSQTFVQDNHSRSSKGVLRGLHYQLNHPQGKFIYVVTGEIFDVAVDIRKSSPTFGQWCGIVLSEQNKKQFYIPEGFAHGFCVLSDMADVVYKCTNIYRSDDEAGVLWSDPKIAIEWPISKPIISKKDAALVPLNEMAKDSLPT